MATVKQQEELNSFLDIENSDSQMLSPQDDREAEGQQTRGANSQDIQSCPGQVVANGNGVYHMSNSFSEDLERFLAGEKVQGGGPKLLKRLRQELWRRRVLRPLALSMTLLALVAVIASVVVHQQGAERAARLEQDRRAEALWAQAAEDDASLAQAESGLTAMLEDSPEHPRALLRRAMIRVRRLQTADVLPAATVTQPLSKDDAERPMQLRLGYGRTVNRPDLRELSPSTYFDPRTGREAVTVRAYSAVCS